VLDLTGKYNRLWFGVDRPYRQRYFCICGCKQTVTLRPVPSRKTEEKPAVRKSPRFSTARLTPALDLAGKRLRDRYSQKSPMERD
jgi:hypothetical protein